MKNLALIECVFTNHTSEIYPAKVGLFIQIIRNEEKNKK